MLHCSENGAARIRRAAYKPRSLESVAQLLDKLRMRWVVKEDDVTVGRGSEQGSSPLRVRRSISFGIYLLGCGTFVLNGIAKRRLVSVFIIIIIIIRLTLPVPSRSM